MVRLAVSLLLVVVVATVATKVSSFAPLRTRRSDVSVQMGYVPDGLTPDQWKAQQAKERAETKKKRFGALGPQTFQSRSLASFQKDLEKGKASHLMPVMFAKERVKKGEIKQEDIPYMQRMGAWDNSDVKGAQKKQWSELDKQYEKDTKGGGMFGMDWTGGRARQGPQAKKAADKASNNANKPATRKLFGMF